MYMHIPRDNGCGLCGLPCDKGEYVMVKVGLDQPSVKVCLPCGEKIERMRDKADGWWFNEDEG